MPKTKNLVKRLFILDHLLRLAAGGNGLPNGDNSRTRNDNYTLSGLTYRVNEILERDWSGNTPFEELSERTVKEDLSVMRREFGVQIVCDIRYHNGQRLDGIYRYPNRYCSIFHSGLNNDEAADAKAMLRSLRRFISHDQFVFLTSGERGTNPYHSLLKLFYNDELKDEQAQIAKEATSLDVASVLFDSAIQLYRGAEFIDDLSEAISESRMVRIQLTDDALAKGGLMEFEYYPYVLKQYNNRWYCFGYCPHPNWAEFHKVAPCSSMPLHEIKSVKFVGEREMALLSEQYPSIKSYYPAHRIEDWDQEVFNQIVGVSVDMNLWTKGKLRTPQEVVIAFHPSRLKYEISKPLHDSAKQMPGEKREDGWVVFRFSLHPNEEFIQQIIMRSPMVKVLSPPTFASEVAKRLKKAVHLYD